MPHLYPGKIVLFRWRPGQVRAGNVDAAAIVTKVYPDDFVDLRIIPAQSHPGDDLNQNRVAQMSESVQGHCWHFTPEDQYIAGLEQRLAALENVVMEQALAKAEAERAPLPAKSGKRKAA